MTQKEIRDARRALVKRRGELANEIKQLDDAIAALNVVLGDERKPAPQRPPRSRVRPAIEHYLRDNRRVVHADEIVDSLKFQGGRALVQGPQGDRGDRPHTDAGR